jgi:hypothetical protein
VRHEPDCCYCSQPAKKKIKKFAFRLPFELVPCRLRGRLQHDCGSPSHGNDLEPNEVPAGEARTSGANEGERELRWRGRKAGIMRKKKERKSMPKTKRRKLARQLDFLGIGSLALEKIGLPWFWRAFCLTKF